jgi:hypothetical protein
MARYGNLDGTGRDQFSLGSAEVNGIRRTITGETALYDPTSGVATIAEMLAGGTDIDDIMTSRVMGQVLVSRITGNVLVKR